jgi:hypothetical protein
MVSLPFEAEQLLDRGAFCYVGVSTPRGPHVTPTVYSMADGRVWVTTSRGSVKARSWRAEPWVGGLVRVGEAALSFTGVVRTYDLLDRGTWVRDLLDAPALTLASSRFTRKNARFFAGYAVDARHVPLSWTPPGRVFAAVEIERTVLLDGEERSATAGTWGSAPIPTRERFRAARVGASPLERLPEDVAEAFGRTGSAVLSVQGARGIVTLPAHWVADGAALYAVLPEDELALAEPERDTLPVALVIDRASWWRAREMTGAMVRGEAEVHVLDRLGAGARSAERIVAAAGVGPAGRVLLRLRPERLVWWRGWSSGTQVVA